MFIGVQENFAKFTIKMLCHCILNKFTRCRLQYFINDMLSRDFQEIFQNNLFAEHLKVIVSVIINGMTLPHGT